MGPLFDAEAIKREKLLDILHRACANPGNIGEVADELALDWFPVFCVDPQGNVAIKIGSGAKK